MAQDQAMDYEFYENEKSYQSPEAISGIAERRLVEWEKVEAIKEKILNLTTENKLAHVK